MANTIRYPIVRVQTRESNGVLWKVLIESEDGETVVELPVRGVESDHPANDIGVVNLKVGTNRVRFEHLTEKECGYAD